jgi:alpha-L-rhamnosidase
MKTLRRISAVVIALVMATMALSCNKHEEAIRIDALPDHAWDASIWISAKDAQVVTGKIRNGNERSADGTSWFVLDVENPQKVVSAVWMTSALGVYDIYVNGKLVGAEVLKPGFTHNEKTKYSFTYDITALVKKGNGAENVFSAQVTPGWWGDKIVTPSGREGMVGRKCAFRGVIELTLSDGTKQYYPTGLGGWKAGVAGPVKHAAIFDGEEYDAREPMGYEVVD